VTAPAALARIFGIKAAEGTRKMLRRGALVLVAVCLAAPASAQQNIADADAISRCLCLQQDVDARSATVSASRQALDQAQAESSRLAAEVDRRRGQVQVNSDTDIAAFTDLLHRSEDATARVNAEQVPAYNASVAAYNRSLAVYGGECAGKSFDAAALDRAKANLVCPKP
jgi:hypothetical protein